ncbi:Uncharacterized membrane protein [Pseudoxanthobacter soli DSM 19599]|uniref:Uncharacterized membrane protein n=2 Tax=Pseudoxanthobacter TaxID=433838 RepID=A0A1M7ZMA8_9HYPH|nr:Uncharacterized membrane protein [Pseudoxanthobacter soli DSM 19599]
MPSESERPRLSRYFSKLRWRRNGHPGRALLPALLSCAVLGLGLAAQTTPARADLRLCNKTSGGIGVAIGYKTPKTWITEGWWNIDAGACSLVIEGPLNARYYYVYAVDNANGGEWGGQAFMCTREKEFTIEGIGDCVRRGFERTGFFEIDTGEQRNWTIQLTDKPGTAGAGEQKR